MDGGISPSTEASALLLDLHTNAKTKEKELQYLMVISDMSSLKLSETLDFNLIEDLYSVL